MDPPSRLRSVHSLHRVGGRQGATGRPAAFSYRRGEPMVAKLGRWGSVQDPGPVIAPAQRPRP